VRPATGCRRRTRADRCPPWHRLTRSLARHSAKLTRQKHLARFLRAVQNPLRSFDSGIGDRDNGRRTVRAAVAASRRRGLRGRRDQVGHRRCKSCPPSPRASPAATPQTRRLTPRNQVFSRTDCGYCNAAKRILDSETARVRASGCGAAAPPLVVELDAALPPERARAVADVLRERTGAATVPRVFVGGKLVGGAVETERYARMGGLSAAVRAGAGCAPR
jgi:glutaredoxin